MTVLKRSRFASIVNSGGRQTEDEALHFGVDDALVPGELSTYEVSLVAGKSTSAGP